jgi:hypothetical protein
MLILLLSLQYINCLSALGTDSAFTRHTRQYSRTKLNFIYKNVAWYLDAHYEIWSIMPNYLNKSTYTMILFYAI